MLTVCPLCPLEQSIHWGVFLFVWVFFCHSLVLCLQTLVSNASWRRFLSSLLRTHPNHLSLLSCCFPLILQTWWHHSAYGPAMTPLSLPSNILFQWLQIFSSVSLWSSMSDPYRQANQININIYVPHLSQASAFKYSWGLVTSKGRTQQRTANKTGGSLAPGDWSDLW